MNLTKFQVQYKPLSGQFKDSIIGCGVNKHHITHTFEQINHNIQYAYVIVIILNGAGRFIGNDGKEHQLNVGDGFQRIPNKNHRYILEPQKNYQEAFLHLPKSYYELIRGYGFQKEIDEKIHVTINQDLINHFYELIEDIKSSQGLELCNVLFKMSNFCIKILSNLNQTKSKSYHQSLIDEACLLIEESLRKDINLPTLLSKLPISYERLRKIFKDNLNNTPGNYRIQKRIQLGQEILLNQSLNVNQTAQYLGYPDTFTFSKQFKQLIGESPEKFLKNLHIKKT